MTCELVGPAGQFRVGDDLGDQAPLRRLRRRQRPVGNHQFLCTAHADEPRQVVRRGAVRAEPGLGVGGADELLDLRAEMAAGRGDVAIEDGQFSLADYRGFLTANDESIAARDLAGEFRRAS